MSKHLQSHCHNSLPLKISVGSSSLRDGGWQAGVAGSWSRTPRPPHPSACQGIAARYRALTAHSPTCPTDANDPQRHQHAAPQPAPTARRCWCIHTLPEPCSICFPHYWPVSVVLQLSDSLISRRAAGSPIQRLHLCLVADAQRWHQWRESSQSCALIAAEFCLQKADYLGRMDQFVIILWEISICVSHPDTPQ